MVLCLWSDGISQSLFPEKIREIDIFIFKDGTLSVIQKKLYAAALTHIAKLPRQRAEFVDGIERHHSHGGNGQAPADHVSPGRKHVGAVVWRVECGKAYHHCELQQTMI